MKLYSISSVAFSSCIRFAKENKSPNVKFVVRKGP